MDSMLIGGTRQEFYIRCELKNQKIPDLIIEPKLYIRKAIFYRTFILHHNPDSYRD